MKTQTTEELQSVTRKLLSLAGDNKVITTIEVNSYMKLMAHDPKTVYSATCQAIMRVGFENLWKNHSEFMNKLQAVHPPLSKFIVRSRVTLSAANEKELFVRKEPVILKWQVKQLIDSANRDNLIDLSQSVLYLDLVDWEEGNYIFVELDILRMVEKFGYNELRDKVPNVLVYIKTYYEVWFDLVLKPHQEAIKNGLRKND